MVFNRNSLSQRHLGTHLDEKLDFNARIKDKISKAYRGTGIIKKLQSNLPINALLTIYILHKTPFRLW